MKKVSHEKIFKLVGARLRSRRIALGLSQNSLGKAVGITFQQIQKYENGSNAANIARLYEFSQHLKVPVSYFFEDIEVPSTKPLTNPSSSDREVLELMKAFTRIPNRAVRKRVADLVRSINLVTLEDELAKETLSTPEKASKG